MIRITPIRVIGPDNEQIGIIETHEALRIAAEAGMDLVEVSPDAHPPVCKIMDFGKHKYEQSKRQRKNRAASKGQELKEIRLGRSIKIDKHDIEIRINQARKFLLAGHKVQVNQRFRGREIVNQKLGLDNLNEVAKALVEIARVEMAPRFAGSTASILLAPDKAKITALGLKPESVNVPDYEHPEDDNDDFDDEA